MISKSGNLKKMTAQNSANGLSYTLPIGSDELNISDFIGRNIKISFTGAINCNECGASTEKTYGDGFCGTCHTTLAKCDICRIKPEKCHYDQGTCRQPAWGEENCLTQHVVYLSYTSGFKVGITRQKNIPSRWIDQGALKAIPIFYVQSRLIAGEVEEAFKSLIADKSHWLKMLRATEAPSDEDFNALKEKVTQEANALVDKLRLHYGADAIKTANETAPTALTYPILSVEPFVKNKAHKLIPESPVEGTLHGIKGQYLYIGDSVISVRKYIGHHCEIQLAS